jgi:hypothetical protein
MSARAHSLATGCSMDGTSLALISFVAFALLAEAEEDRQEVKQGRVLRARWICRGSRRRLEGDRKRCPLSVGRELCLLAHLRRPRRTTKVTHTCEQAWLRSRSSKKEGDNRGFCAAVLRLGTEGRRTEQVEYIEPATA